MKKAGRARASISDSSYVKCSEQSDSPRRRKWTSGSQGLLGKFGGIQFHTIRMYRMPLDWFRWLNMPSYVLFSSSPQKQAKKQKPTT